MVKFAAVIKGAAAPDRGIATAAVERNIVRPPPPPGSPRPNAEPARRDPATDDPLDSATRTAVLLAPPAPSATPLAAATTTTTTTTIDPRLASELLEKAAFWGDGHRGVARLRFGKTARSGLSGATITLEHDGESISLRVDGVDDPSVLDRLRAQLASRGVELRES